MSDYDGGDQVEIVKEVMSPVSGLVVHPKKGLVFWSEGGDQPRIVRARMDGTEQKVLFHSRHEVLSPAGLSVDLVRDRIYWTDSSLHRISSADLDGSSVRVVLTDSQHLQQPVSVSVLEDWVYWSDVDTHTNNIYKANKFDGSGLVRIAEDQLQQSQIFVKAFHSVLQPNWKNYCQTRERKCSHICIPDIHEAKQTSCLCPPDWRLSEDNTTCQDRNKSKAVTSHFGLEEELEAHQNSQQKKNLILVLIIGLIGASLVLVILVSFILTHNYTGLTDSFSLDLSLGV